MQTIRRLQFRIQKFRQKGKQITTIEQKNADFTLGNRTLVQQIILIEMQQSKTDVSFAINVIHFKML